MVNAVRIVNMALALFSAAIALWSASYTTPSSWLIVAGFVLWILTPFAAFDLVVQRTAAPMWAVYLTCAAMLVSGLAAYFLYTRTFLFNPAPDAQDPLAFVVLPLYQLGLAGITLLVVALGRPTAR